MHLPDEYQWYYKGPWLAVGHSFYAPRPNPQVSKPTIVPLIPVVPSKLECSSNGADVDITQFVPPRTCCWCIETKGRSSRAVPYQYHHDTGLQSLYQVRSERSSFWHIYYSGSWASSWPHWKESLSSKNFELSGNALKTAFLHKPREKQLWIRWDHCYQPKPINSFVPHPAAMAFFRRDCSYVFLRGLVSFRPLTNPLC